MALTERTIRAAAGQPGGDPTANISWQIAVVAELLAIDPEQMVGYIVLGYTSGDNLTLTTNACCLAQLVTQLADTLPHLASDAAHMDQSGGHLLECVNQQAGHGGE